MLRPAALATALLLAALAALGSAAPAGAAPSTSTLTGRGSMLQGGVEPTSTGDADSPRISGSGRYLLFTSKAGLVPADENNVDDVYVRDLLTDRVELVSLEADGDIPVSNSFAGAISTNGRWVAFYSLSNRIVDGDTNGVMDVFLRDRLNGTNERVSISSAGQQSTTESPYSWSPTHIDVSDDGRYVAFTSTGAVFGAGSLSKVLVRDRQTGMTEMVSVSSSEQPPNANSSAFSMTPNGRYVAFASNASNLVATDTNGTSGDIFLRDRVAGSTTLVSRSAAGTQSTYGASLPSISDDGNKVAFSHNGLLIEGDQTTVSDVLLRNISANTTTKVSTDTGGGEADHPILYPEISGDGTTVAWQSLSGEYVNGGGNGKVHIFTRVGTNPIRRASVTTGGQLADGDSSRPHLSRDGKVLVFDSLATNLATGDTGSRDVFVRRNPELGPHGTPSAFATAMVQHFTGAAGGALIGGIRTRIERGTSPEREILLLANAPSYASVRAPVARLYTAYFARLPDTAGFEYWLAQRQAGKTLAWVSAQFAKAPEFTTLYGSTTNTQFVNLVYTNVLGRTPSSADLAYWKGQLDAGLDRGSMMISFSELAEGRARFRPQADTVLVSMALLGAIPGTTLRNAMVADMRNDSSELGISRLLRSAEYAAAV